MAGSHNDINVLQRSPQFGRFADGNAPSMSFEVMGHTYTKGYYLADGIYTEWPVFVKTHRNPTEDKYSRFAKEQEASQKNVERAFAVLQCRWAIVRYPAKAWSVQQMWEVMTACVIMSWLLQTLYRLLFSNFSIHIMRIETGQPTLPSMKIW
jgi:hypothetical protein